LAQVAVLRLLQQLSQVYSVMRVSALADLVPFFSFGEVEQLIVDAVKHNYLHVRARACSDGLQLRRVARQPGCVVGSLSAGKGRRRRGEGQEIATDQCPRWGRKRESDMRHVIIYGSCGSSACQPRKQALRAAPQGRRR